MTPPYEWVVECRLVTDRVAQGDDLGRFSSKYSVYIRERNYKLPFPQSPFSTEKHISRLKEKF